MVVAFGSTSATGAAGGCWLIGGGGMLNDGGGNRVNMNDGNGTPGGTMPGGGALGTI